MTTQIATVSIDGSSAEVILPSGNDIKFYDLDGSDYVGIKGPDVVAASYELTYPSAQGGVGEYLVNDGTGVLGWSSDPAPHGALTLAPPPANGLVLDVPAQELSLPVTADVAIKTLGLAQVGTNAVTIQTQNPSDLYSLTLPNTAGVANQVPLNTGAATLAWRSIDSANTVSTIVSRDGAGDFSGGTITAETEIVTDDISERLAGSGVTIDGVLIKDGSVTAPSAINQLTLGTGFAAIISSTQTIADKTFTIPDTATGEFVMSTGNQTISGIKTFSGTVNLSGSTASTPIILNGAKNIVSTAALTNGQLLIGSTGADPAVGTLTGTANQVIITNGAGTITLSTPQNIALASTPTFASETLTAANNQLTLSGPAQNVIINAVEPAVATRTYTIPDAGANANFILSSDATGSQTINGDILLNDLTASRPLQLDGTKTIISSGINLSDLNSTTANALPVSRGGTNIVALTGDKVLLSATGGLSVAESASLENGELVIGSTGLPPVVTTLTGTANRVTVTNGAGSITLSAPQDIATASTPTFASETLTAANNQLTLSGPTRNAIINAVEPAVATRTYTIPDAGANANFIMSSDVSGTRTINDAILLDDLTASRPLQLDGTKTIISAGINLSSLTNTTADALPVSRGGTNIVALTGDRVLLSATGGLSVAESASLENGELVIGSTGLPPVITTLTQTLNQVLVTNGAGTITLSTPQDIATASTPTFASETLSAATNQLTLSGPTRHAIISAVEPAVATRTYTILDAGANANFILSSNSTGSQNISGNLIMETTGQLSIGPKNITQYDVDYTLFDLYQYPFTVVIGQIVGGGDALKTAITTFGGGALPTTPNVYEINDDLAYNGSIDLSGVNNIVIRGAVGKSPSILMPSASAFYIRNGAGLGGTNTSYVTIGNISFTASAADYHFLYIWRQAGGTYVCDHINVKDCVMNGNGISSVGGIVIKDDIGSAVDYFVTSMRVENCIFRNLLAQADEASLMLMGVDDYIGNKNSFSWTDVTPGGTPHNFYWIRESNTTEIGGRFFDQYRTTNAAYVWYVKISQDNLTNRGFLPTTNNFYDCSFVKSYADVSHGLVEVVHDNAASGDISELTLKFERCKFVSSQGCGFIMTGTGAPLAELVNLTIDECEFSKNQIAIKEDSTFPSADAGVISIINNTFDGNLVNVEGTEFLAAVSHNINEQDTTYSPQNFTPYITLNSDTVTEYSIADKYYFGRQELSDIIDPSKFAINYPMTVTALTNVTLNNLRNIVCSADGRYVYALYDDTVAGPATTSYVERSDDYGATFTAVTVAGVVECFALDICCSASGRYLYVLVRDKAAPAQLNLYTSANYGASFTLSTVIWTIKAGGTATATVCCSAYGDIVYVFTETAAADLESAHKSINFGAAFSPVSTAASDQLQFIRSACSSDGTYVFAISATGRYLRSTNVGASFTLVNYAATMASMQSVSVSNSGQYVVFSGTLAPNSIVNGSSDYGASFASFSLVPYAGSVPVASQSQDGSVVIVAYDTGAADMMNYTTNAIYGNASVWSSDFNYTGGNIVPSAIALSANNKLIFTLDGDSNIRISQVNELKTPANSTGINLGVIAANHQITDPAEIAQFTALNNVFPAIASNVGKFGFFYSSIDNGTSYGIHSVYLKTTAIYEVM